MGYESGPSWCPRCGEGRLKGASYCHRCGTAHLPEQVQAISSKPLSTKALLWRIFGGLAIAGVVWLGVLFGFFAMLGYNPFRPKPEAEIVWRHNGAGGASGHLRNLTNRTLPGLTITASGTVVDEQRGFVTGVRPAQQAAYWYWEGSLQQRSRLPRNRRIPQIGEPGGAVDMYPTRASVPPNDQWLFYFHEPLPGGFPADIEVRDETGRRIPIVQRLLTPGS